MKKALAAVVLFVVTSVAIAACPISAPYRCVPGWNGKQVCGCGV